MTTLRTKGSLRKLARYPVARDLADVANALQSAKLHRFVDKVAGLESDARVHRDVCLVKAH